ncbi:MAG: VTT domain-containing protein [Chloroflexi bacterium]|nr:VTT domain-containing protein [Chloroflexota bacterium]
MGQQVSLSCVTKRRLLGAAVVLAILGGSVWVACARPNLEGLAVYGYPGLFAVMFASSASVLLPLPGFATVMAAGTMANPLLIALFAGPGSALGELTGYIAGQGGRNMLEKRHIGVVRRFEHWLDKYGFWALLVFAAIPNPAFDMVGIAAGSLGFPVRKFLVACLVGNTIKYLFLASIGSTAISLLARA